MTTEQRIDYLYRIADTTVINGQRLAEWCGHGPVLEEDIALTNHALDYLGQATMAYRHIAELDGKGHDEDHYAFLRDTKDFRNLLITELPVGDYGFTVARQFVFSSWYYLFLQELVKSKDAFLSAFGEKSIKEVRYHVQHASDWVKRLGDGTEESHARMQKAINDIWDFTGEMFDMDEVDQTALAIGIGVDNAALRAEWRKNVEAVLTEATLTTPADGYSQRGSKQGKHTEHLGFILADMQFLQRTYPGAKW